MLSIDFEEVMNDDNDNFGEISIEHDEFLHNYLRNLNSMQFSKYKLMTLLSEKKPIPTQIIKC